MELKHELLKIIKSSRLDSSSKDIWEIFLEVCTVDQTTAILDLLKDNPKSLNFLTENINDKFWAMKTWDRKYLSEIIAKEKNYLLG